MKPRIEEVLVAAPACEPVSLAEMKEHLRVDHNDENAQIERNIRTARRYCEAFQNRTYITTTYDYKLDAFPLSSCAIELPRSPLQNVTSITYVSGDGTTATWDAASYRVDTSSEPPRITPAYGGSYPSTLPVTGAVTIRAVLGYGLTGRSVPDDTVSAMLLIGEHLRINRTAMFDGNTIPRQIILGVHDLLNSNVVEFV